MSERISPLEAPYAPETAALLHRMMPTDEEPLALFRLYARNQQLAQALHDWGSYQLSRRLSLDLRDRELVINRTCARCGCEYEWGVHVARFASRAGLTDAQIASLTHGTSTDECWTTERDRLLLDAVDALHTHHDLDARLWTRISTEFAPEQLLDLFMLCGWYHAISITARATRLAPEPGTPRFSDFAPAASDRDHAWPSGR